ncbi:hypothetical protein [Dyella tabacisoli]|uniref:Uncharacterized protein n=1 Tax=Dyella tabacisoli TaxID=2282381 RepID=A0A369URE5_9GAMM|nr:hypothetical protein [Dyella tabacisoli]RDD83091.1 hypothetical protein DVJ77_00260 [Dyella tabacisoli]
MQRLFSMFPLGGPGMGLVLLRLSLASLLVLDRDSVGSALPDQVILACLITVAAAVLLGLLTPIATSISFLVGCLALFHAGIFGTWYASLTLLNAIALFLLGPGAYSLDARIYGRRILVLPSKKS